MFKAFNLSGFDKTFFDPAYQDELVDRGRRVIIAGKAGIEETLTTIVSNRAVLDGQRIQKTWFPQVGADILLSHSHRNEEDVLILAGWLDDRFGLKGFVDSSIWGYAGHLLRMIDDKYCYQADSRTYSYERRNESTSHVHMILMTALGMMIHKTECLVFVNTPESITAQDVVSAQTYSPWIYAELTIAGMVEVVMPDRLKNRRRLIEGMVKGAEQNRGLSILHTIENMERFRPIDGAVLRSWDDECRVNGTKALDVLYEVAGR